MKVEKAQEPENEANSLSDVLRKLKPNEMLRLTTAREGRNFPSTSFRIAKERNVKFYTRDDGDDILVFVKPL